MKILGSVILMLSFVALAASPALAAPKTGYFDLQVVLQTSKWGKQSNEEFKVQGEKIKQEVDEKAKTFKSARDEFEKKRDVMDEKARTKRLKELQEMQNEGEKLIIESNAKLSKLSQELSAPLVEKILEIVKRIGKEEKYDYIFERDKGGIVFATEKEDLTQRIIDELNKITPKK